MEALFVYGPLDGEVRSVSGSPPWLRVPVNDDPDSFSEALYKKVSYSDIDGSKHHVYSFHYTDVSPLQRVLELAKDKANEVD